MKNFIYDVPVKIYFGTDQLVNLVDELKKHGKRVLLTYGGGSIKKIGLYDKIMQQINESDIEIFEFSGIEPNPRIESVREGAEICKKNNIDVILAVGGGSTIDASKFIAAGTFVDFDPWDFFTKNAPIKKALPIVTVLTLSATGSEMNCGGVISNLSTNQKIGRKDRHVLPKASFLDPTNTFTVNAYQTACGSVDIISHIFEVYFNMNSDLYMLDSVMESLIKTVIKYAPIAINKPDNYEARANLMWASSWAINTFISSGKTQGWTCHPLEHELSAFYDITHGLGLAILTPRWLSYCLSEATVSRYYEFGKNVFGIDSSLPQMDVAKKAIELISEFFFKTLNLKSNFTEIGIDTTHFENMSKKACGDKEINGFIKLTPSDIKKIYEMCL